MSVLLGCVLLTALTGAAHAEEKKTVVILEIQGGNKQLQQAILSALKDKYIIVPAAKWNLAAKRLNVTGQAPEDIAIVASAVKADVIITGRIKQDKDSGQWKANIAARNGMSGNPVGKLTYDLKSQKLEAETIAQVEKDIGPAVEKAIKGEPPSPVATTQGDPTEPPPRPLLDTSTDEDPIAKLRKQEEEERRRQEAGLKRPVWYPFFDVGVGFILSGRNFGFAEEGDGSSVGCYDFASKGPDPNDPSLTPQSVYSYSKKLSRCPAYATSVAGGIHVDLTGYPLAFLRVNPIRGLGIGGSFDYVFWPPSSTGGANPVNLDTTEFRFEVGLRYHYNVRNKRSLPSILASIQYGGHYFGIGKEQRSYQYTDENFVTRTAQGQDDHGLPNIFYQYVTFGVGGRIPYFANDKLYFGLLLNFNYHLVLSYGEIATAFDRNASTESLYSSSGYGPVNSGFGLRGSLTVLEAMIYRGLTIRLQGYYELFKYGFQFGSGSNNNVTLPPTDRRVDFGARHIAQDATDNYFGGIVQIGYQY